MIQQMRQSCNVMTESVNSLQQTVGPLQQTAAAGHNGGSPTTGQGRPTPQPGVASSKTTPLNPLAFPPPITSQPSQSGWLDDNRLERLDPKGCPPLGRKSHPSYRIVWLAVDSNDDVLVSSDCDDSGDVLVIVTVMTVVMMSW